MSFSNVLPTCLLLWTLPCFKHIFAHFSNPKFILMSLLTAFTIFIPFSKSISFLPSSFKSSICNKWLTFLSVLCTWYQKSAWFSSFGNGRCALQKSNGETEPPWNIPCISEWVVTVLLPALYLNEALCSVSPLITYKIRQFYCSLLPVLLIFLPSYVECCQMLSVNQSRLYLNSCSSFCYPHILLLISLIDPCTLYFQGDIPFALLVISSALPDVWRFFWLLFLVGSCTWLLSM